MSKVAVDSSLISAVQRNRVDRSMLEVELHRLTKEQESDIRMFNNERQKFKVKYSRLDVLLDRRSNDVSTDMKLFKSTLKFKTFIEKNCSLYKKTVCSFVYKKCIK